MPQQITLFQYSEDFVFLSEDKSYLENIVPLVQDFLQNNLSLSLHPDKLFLKTVASGVDFLGWVHFTKYKVLRTKTKQRMFKSIKNNISEASLQSYFGLMGHGNTQKLMESMVFEHWLSL